LADRVKLRFLPPAHLVARVEDGHVDPLHPLVRVAHGASRVTGGGHQHVEPLPGIAQGAHQPGHQPGGKVLEGGRRALVEPHQVFSRKNVFQRHIEIVGVPDDLPEPLLLDFCGQECLYNQQRGFRVGSALQGLKGIGGEAGDRFRHEEPLVGGLPHQQRLAEGYRFPERGDAGDPVEMTVRAVVSQRLAHAENPRFEYRQWTRRPALFPKRHLNIMFIQRLQKIS